MIEDWKQLIDNMNVGVKALRDDVPGVMKTFADMARAAHGGGALDGKTKELIALAIGVATRCQPCIAYHSQGAVKAGASREEIAETSRHGDLHGCRAVGYVCRGSARGIRSAFEGVIVYQFGPSFITLRAMDQRCTSDGPS